MSADSYEALEARGLEYAIRVPANANLEWEIAELLFRPPGVRVAPREGAMRGSSTAHRGGPRRAGRSAEQLSIEHMPS